MGRLPVMTIIVIVIIVIIVVIVKVRVKVNAIIIIISAKGIRTYVIGRPAAAAAPAAAGRERPARLDRPCTKTTIMMHTDTALNTAVNHACSPAKELWTPGHNMPCANARVHGTGVSADIGECARGAPAAGGGGAKPRAERNPQHPRTRFVLLWIALMMIVADRAAAAFGKQGPCCMELTLESGPRSSGPRPLTGTRGGGAWEVPE
jgi:hypothetical protein